MDNLYTDDYKKDRGKPFTLDDIVDSNYYDFVNGMKESCKAYNMNNMPEIIKQCEKELQNKREALILEDIIDIYNGIYPSYKIYLDVKKRETDTVNKLNNEQMEGFPQMVGINKVQYTFYLKPYICNEFMFDYLMKKRGEKNNAN